jgi:hypothetical protein
MKFKIYEGITIADVIILIFNITMVVLVNVQVYFEASFYSDMLSFFSHEWRLSIICFLSALSLVLTIFLIYFKYRTYKRIKRDFLDGRPWN